MNNQDVYKLLEKAVQPGKFTWADFGSGDGAFTLALRELIGPEVEIFSVDENKVRLKNQQKAFERQFPNFNLQFFVEDFTRNLDFRNLDGIVMANSLHFVKDQAGLLHKLKTYLKPKGRLVVVEYDTDKAGYYIPFPLSFETFKTLATKNGFTYPELLATAPSTYHGRMYSAAAS